MKTENPELTLESFKKCIEKINSLEHCNEFLNSGFKCFILWLIINWGGDFDENETCNSRRL